MTAPDGAQARYREEEIRRLLAENAGLLVPSDGLPTIRARIARRRWWRRVWDLLTVHRHVTKLQPDWLDTEDVRCRICGERPCKNGAPVASGAPPNPTAVKEPTMSHDFIEESTPRGRQMAAALALAKLLESGPNEVAEWRIDDLGRLHGHVRRAHSDADARRAVHEFAGFLGNKGAARRQGRNERSEWIHLHTCGTYRGVQVNVWTHVGIRAISPYGSFGGASEPSVYEDMGVRDAIRAAWRDGGTR